MVREGFERQRLAVIPRPLVREAAARPITSTLQVTDAGWFPHAAGHERLRENGSPESILLLCTDGAGWVEMDGVRHAVRAPGFAMIPAGTPHGYGASASAPWTIWWLHVHGPVAQELCAELEGGVGRLGDPARAVALCEQIVATLERDPSRAHLVRASGLAWNLLALLAAQSGGHESNDPLQRAMGLLAENLDRTVSIDEVARHARVSPSHLGALFRTATGGGAIAYHSTLRMARARQLLDGTTLPISGVAEATGYPDPLYFSRQFRRTHGLSPRAYRDQHKG